MRCLQPRAMVQVGCTPPFGRYGIYTILVPSALGCVNPIQPARRGVTYTYHLTHRFVRKPGSVRPTKITDAVLRAVGS